MKIKTIFAPVLLTFALMSNASAQPSNHSLPKIAPDIEKRLAQLPRTSIDYDKTLLSENDKQVVIKLIEAAKIIDSLYWLQVSPNNLALNAELTRAAKKSKTYNFALQYFNIMKGKWDRLAQNESFIAPFGANGKKPEGAGFYPQDLTKEEFDNWIAAHPIDKSSFQNLTTIIDRHGQTLKAIPYSAYYARYLVPAAVKLREAAAITTNASLRNYLLKRADAFASDDYFASDIAWMDLDSQIEVVIGPYEVYEDALFNYKASFEAFIMAVDKNESDKLKTYGDHLRDMEMNLPIPDQYKNPNRGFESPIRVVQEIYAGGDARKAVIATAFNLPNDEKVRMAKGSKKIMIKNVMEAKYFKTGEPIARRILDPSQTLSFEAYFNQILFHELSHGLGPGVIVGPDGQKNEVRIYLKELYASIEECKADVLGVWNLLYAIDNHFVNGFDKETLYSTYASLIFRLLRHGIDEAHGRANAVQWSWLREKGAIVPTSNDFYKVDAAKMYDGIKSLANELLLIEATGDYARAKQLLDNYGRSTQEIASITQRLSDIPVDITPVFTAAGEQ